SEFSNDRVFSGSHTGYGSINVLYSDWSNIVTVMFEIKLNVKAQTAITQKIVALDERLTVFVNGVNSAAVQNTGLINYVLPAGEVLLQILLLNHGGGLAGLTLLGDFIDNNNIKFA